MDNSIEKTKNKVKTIIVSTQENFLIKIIVIRFQMPIVRVTRLMNLRWTSTTQKNQQIQMIIQAKRATEDLEIKNATIRGIMETRRINQTKFTMKQQ